MALKHKYIWLLGAHYDYEALIPDAQSQDLLILIAD